MPSIRYCTPEWLEECTRRYNGNPSLQSKLKKITQKMCYVIKADPSWGIDLDMVFGAFFDQGNLLTLRFFSESEAVKESDFILEATPLEWVNLLRKKNKFIARFMMQEVKLKQGEKVDVLKLAPYANDLIDVLSFEGLQYPDQMSTDELEAYRLHVKEFGTGLK